MLLAVSYEAGPFDELVRSFEAGRLGAIQNLLEHYYAKVNNPASEAPMGLGS